MIYLTLLLSTALICATVVICFALFFHNKLELKQQTESKVIEELTSKVEALRIQQGFKR